MRFARRRENPIGEINSASFRAVWTGSQWRNQLGEPPRIIGREANG